MNTTDLTDGPWLSAFYVDLPSKLRSKSNYRRGKKGWDALASFEAVTRATFQKYVPYEWELGDKTDPVPARPIVVLVVYARSMLDSSNFTKSVADAAESVLVHNDASITSTATFAERAQKGQRCSVAAALLEPGASISEQAEATQELIRRTHDWFTGTED